MVMVSQLMQVVGKSNRLKILILIIIGFLTYLNSFHNLFVWDDSHFIIQNIFVHSLSYIPQIFTSNTIAGAGATSDYYRPLTSLSFAIDYHFWGNNVLGYHLTNTFLHIASGIILFLFLLRIKFNKTLSFWVSAIFLVHPVQTEAVTYLSSRGDSFYSLLFLISLYLFSSTIYLRKTTIPKIALLFLSILSFGLSIIAKETALALTPIYIGVLFLYKLQNNLSLTSLHQKYRNQIITIMFIFLLTIIYVIIRINYLSFHNFFNFTGFDDIYTRSLLVRFYTFCKVFFTYLQLLIYPYPLYLERSTTFVLSPISPFVVSAILVFLIVFFLGILEIKQKKQAWILFGLVWFVSHILPASGIIPITGTHHENWLYMPLVGFLITTFSIAKFIFPKVVLPKYKKILTFFALGVVIIFMYMTMLQNTKWKDNITYYEHNLKFVDSARVNLNLGNAYLGANMDDKALIHLKKAIQIKDIYPQTHYNLGKLYQKQGQDDLAEKEYFSSLRLDPDFIFAYTALINLYLKDQKFDRALPLVQTILKIYPFDVSINLLLASVENRLGNTDLANQQIAKISTSDPKINNLITQIKLKQDDLTSYVK
ncbi:tetratricopeptide repeat protein [Candidatus Daviesbacteria bacterium]|nr:tetratricopeptide repeat protein [Candidatus Daviesbacteria bacterium]